MPAPTKYPDWATDGANTVEPPAGKVAAGWLPAEQPPAGWFNWWQHIVGLWTRWLEERINSLEVGQGDLSADAALKSQVNVFTETQVIDVEPDSAMLYSVRKVADDGANRWKLVMSLPTQGAAWSGLFVGQSPDGFALVTNAQWNVSEQTWQQLDLAYPSTALIEQAGQQTVSLVPLGTAAPWANWPNGGGGDLMVGGNIQANGSGPTSGAVIARNVFLYATPKQHVTYKSIFTGGLGDGKYTYGGDPLFPFVKLEMPGDQHYWPLNLPHGAKLLGVEVSVAKTGTGTLVGWVFARDSVGTFGTGAPFDLQLGTGNTAASGMVNLAINCDPAGPDEPPKIDLALLDYYLKIKASADGGEEIYAIRVTWEEAGVSCYPG